MTINTFSRNSSTEDTLKLKQIWQSLDEESCPNQYNFHTHTNCSDGRLDPLELIQQAVDIGLKGLAITDHHSIKGFQIVQDWLEKQEQASLPQLWTGLEITAQLLGIEVHILGYGFSPTCPALLPYLQGESVTGQMAEVARVIETIHRADGMAVLAHPVRYSQPAEVLIPICADLGIDGVESYYAYGNPKPWQPSPKETSEVLQLAKEYGLLSTCGTDSHGLSLLQRI
jgi:hypothetical protein